MRYAVLILVTLAAGGPIARQCTVAQEPRDEKRTAPADELAELKAEHARLRQSADAVHQDYQELIETLLKSDNEATIMLGLQHMHRCLSYRFHPGSVAIHNELIKLTYSETRAIQQAAALAVMRIWPASAAKHGFQSHGAPWRPVRENAESEPVRNSLDEEIALDGTFTPKQLEAQFRKFGLTVRFHPDINQTPLEIELRGVTARAALTLILEPRGWNYWIEGGNILVAPSTFEKSQPVHVYNVRGILSETMTLERVVELTQRVTSEDNQTATIEAAGDYKISVKGSEFQHDRIATYLGTIAPELKGEF